MNKNYFYSREEDFVSNMFDEIKDFKDYIDILNYYLLYFEERIKYQQYKAKEEIFKDEDSILLFEEVYNFYERMMYELTNYDDYQEYIIHEDEDSIALSYVGDIDIYELQEKKWMIMLDNCTKIYFLTLEDETDEDSDEYYVYYDVTIYERQNNKYNIKKIKVKDNEGLGLSDLNVRYEKPTKWLKEKIINRK